RRIRAVRMSTTAKLCLVALNCSVILVSPSFSADFSLPLTIDFTEVPLPTSSGHKCVFFNPLVQLDWLWYENNYGIRGMPGSGNAEICTRDDFADIPGEFCLSCDALRETVIGPRYLGYHGVGGDISWDERYAPVRSVTL